MRSAGSALRIDDVMSTSVTEDGSPSATPTRPSGHSASMMAAGSFPPFPNPPSTPPWVKWMLVTRPSVPPPGTSAR